MVAVYAANQAPDAALASELGSLLLAHTRIRDARWRLDAIVRRVPALRRFGVPLEATRAQIRELGARAPCPAPLRALLIELLCEHFAAGFARALWLPDWKSCAQAAVDAARPSDVERIVAVAAAGPHARYGLPKTTRRASLADLIALVDDGKAEDAAALARSLRPREQPYAMAHLGRLSLRVAPVREASIRAGAQLLIVREAIAREQLELARSHADAIERTLMREYAYVELAQGLARRGRIVDALRLLYRVTRAELVAERDLLRAEIRLVVRRDRETWIAIDASGAWPLPVWLRPRGWMSGSDREDLIHAARIIRIGLRGDTEVMASAARFARHVSPAALFGFLPRIGVDIDEAVVALRGAANADALLAERIAMRATALAATTRELPDAMRLGLAGLATCDNHDGRSLERAWFDEGLALSSSAARRRRVLIGVAQSCLRTARTQSLDVVRTRLRTLVHLGGSLAADAIAKPLAQLPVEPTVWLAALESLCALDAARAGEIVLDRYTELRRAGIDPLRALDLVVDAGGMTRDRATSFAGTLRVLDAALGERAHSWLADFARRWHARTAAPLDEVALEWIRSCDLQRDPQSLLDELDQVHTAMLAGDAREIAERLARDSRGLRAILLDSPRVDRRMPVWSLSRWQTLLAKAAKPTHHVDVTCVHRFARLLHNPRAAYALVAGDLTRLGVHASTDVRVGEHRYRVRVLDKRRDLLTYLRFADVPARSCFRSDSWAYRDELFHTESETIAAWRDPLTICLHIERAGQPCGFLFGSFADLDGKPALLFNSLHVRPNSAAVRAAILRVVERTVCAPLRIRTLGIANSYGGEGVLPDDYVDARRRGTRLRALIADDQRALRVHDDICDFANQDQPFDLFWRDIERN